MNEKGKAEMHEEIKAEAIEKERKVENCNR